MSNRKQDYEGGLYHLATIYPRLLNKNSSVGVDILLRVVNYAREAELKQYPGLVRSTPMSFEIHAINGILEDDNTGHWDNMPSRRHGEALRMWQSLLAHLRMLAKTGAIVELEELLARLLEGKSAIIWKGLLQLGAEEPAVIGTRIAPLMWAVPLLRSSATSYDAGRLIAKVAGLTEPGQRALSEAAVTTVLEAAQTDNEKRRAEGLVVCFEERDVVLSRTRELLRQFRKRDAAPKNTPEPPALTISSRNGPGRIDAALEADGSSEAERNDFRRLMAPLDEFNSRHLNDPATLVDVEGVYRLALELLSNIQSGRYGLAGTKEARDTAATSFCRFAVAIRTWKDKAPVAIVAKVASVLLDFAREDDRNDRQGPSGWGSVPYWSTAPHIEAAQGLVALIPAVVDDDLRNDIKAGVKRLAESLNAAVRLQIAFGLRRVVQSDAAMAWELIEQAVERESDGHVLSAIIENGIRNLFYASPERARVAITRIMGRHADGGHQDLNDSCVVTLIDISFTGRSSQATEQLNSIADQASTAPGLLHRVPSMLRTTIGAMAGNPPDIDVERARAMGFALLERIGANALIGLTGAHKDLWATKDLPSDDSERLRVVESARKVGQMVDALATELYFASGAHGKEGGDRSETTSKRHFLHHAKGLLQTLVDAALPSATHRLVETLEFLAEGDPKLALLLAARAVRAGSKAGYHTDSLAEPIVVQLAERYLSEFRALLASDSEARASLLDILDVFAVVGWPRVRQLLFRLDEIYR
jgi:hypothetical protein